MWKYLVSLLVLLASSGFGAAQAAQDEVPVCADCYANIVTQDDHQTVDHVRIAPAGSRWVAIGNEGLTSGIIVTPKTDVEGDYVREVGFARIDQYMNQKVSNLGPNEVRVVNGYPLEGAKGVSWNKAIQAAWIAGQGRKENETVIPTRPIWKKEGSYIGQNTTQVINKVVDYDSREYSKVLNVDNKLAMIVDDLNETINLVARASSDTSDNQSSTGSIHNDVNINITASDDPMVE